MLRRNAAAWPGLLSGDPTRRPSPDRAFEQGDDWTRPGSRSDGAKFTIDTFARYFIHDPIHHVYDVTGSSDAQTRSASRRGCN